LAGSVDEFLGRGARALRLGDRSRLGGRLDGENILGGMMIIVVLKKWESMDKRAHSNGGILDAMWAQL